MAVAAAIAGALVLEPNFSTNGLFTNEIRIGFGGTIEPTNNLLEHSLPFQILSQQRIGSEHQAFAMDQLKRTRPPLPWPAMISRKGHRAHATVSSRKLDPQRRQGCTRFPRAIDQAGLTAQVTAAVATAPPVAVAPPRRFDLDELSD